MPEYTSLKSVGQIGDVQLTEHLQSNICSFLDWGLMNLGGYFNVYLNTTQPYGGNPSTLRLSDDPRYYKGTVWDSFKTNWCWEQGIDGSNQPINISGVYVNGQFYPVGTSGQFGYNIAYTHGRVIFNNPLPSNSKVQVEYSYKFYNVYPANIQWFKELMKGSFRIDDPQFNFFGSGLWTIFPESRAQLPAVVVESVPRREHVGKQLGGGQWIYQDMLFHIMAETPEQRNNIVDILTYQSEKRFFMYDKNAMNRSGVYPLNQFGYLVNPSSTYPFLVNNYLYTDVIIRKTTSQEQDNVAQSIYRGSCRWYLEVDSPSI